MKLATFRAPGSDRPQAGEITGERVHALALGLTVETVLAGASADLGDGDWALDEVQLLAPVPAPRTRSTPSA